jgi:hypothetical protein
LTGRLGRFARSIGEKRTFARELSGLCKKGGAFLTAIGNYRCPVDLTRNASLIHGPKCASLVTLREMQEIFVDRGGFSSVQPLSPAGHFSWRRLRGPGMAVARWLEYFWREIAVPHRRWLYASPLNPVLMLWIEK